MNYVSRILFISSIIFRKTPKGTEYTKKQEKKASAAKIFNYYIKPLG